MFKNRHIQVKLVKDSEATSTPEPQLPAVDLDKIHNIVIDVAKTTAVLTAGVVSASFALYTLSQIAINNTNPLYKN